MIGALAGLEREGVEEVGIAGQSRGEVVGCAAALRVERRGCLLGGI